MYVQPRARHRSQKPTDVHENQIISAHVGMFIEDVEPLQNENQKE